MTEPMKLDDVKPLPLSSEQRFEALRMRYEDHVELLRAMTGTDFRLFGGVMTIQLALGGWLASNPVLNWPPLVSILILDGVLAFIGTVLLRNNALRRKEAVATLKNVMAALGFYQAGFFVDGLTINAPGGFRFWGPWYIGGVVVAYVGLLFAAISAKVYG